MKTELGAPIAAGAASWAVGSIAGIPIIAIGAGLAGGIFVLTKAKERMSWLKASGTLLASTLAGGFAGPFIASVGVAWLKQKVPGFDVTDMVAANGCFGLCIGVGSQVFWNSIVARGNRTIRGGSK